MKDTLWGWLLAVLIFAPLVTVLYLNQELTDKKQKRLLFAFAVMMVIEIIVWRKWM